MNARQSVVLEYEGLEDGVSCAGELCPSCRGGSSGEHTLSVSKQDGMLLWTCHRASCGFAGGHRTGTGRVMGGYTRSPSSRGVWGRRYMLEADVLPVSIRRTLYKLYGITGSLAARAGLGWHEAGEDSRLVIPVVDRQGEPLGSVLRSLNGKQPKTLNHTEEGSIAWFTKHDSTSIVIVEDQLSAIRASRYLTSVALLGTNLNESRVAEIRQAKAKRVYLALDKDAFDQAVKHVVRWRSTLPMTLLRLEQDIKNMSEDDVSSLLGGL